MSEANGEGNGLVAEAEESPLRFLTARDFENVARVFEHAHNVTGRAINILNASSIKTLNCIGELERIMQWFGASEEKSRALMAGVLKLETERQRFEAERSASKAETERQAKASKRHAEQVVEDANRQAEHIIDEARRQSDGLAQELANSRRKTKAAIKREEKVQVDLVVKSAKVREKSDNLDRFIARKLRKIDELDTEVRRMEAVAEIIANKTAELAVAAAGEVGLP